MNETLTARAIIARLGLAPHPEGGHFRETFRSPAPGDGRGAMTSILFLLAEGEASHWHRVRDADEIWHFHAGAPLALSLSADGRAVSEHRLGADLAAGESPQVTVPRDCWQAARSLGAWTLVGCTVGPAFDFAGFELAPPDWAPGRD